MKPLRWLISAGFGLLVIFANAAGLDKTAQEKLLISQPLLNPALVLPQARELGSTKGALELLEIKTIVQNVTPAERELAARDAKTLNVSFFADTIQGFDIELLPLTKALFNQIRYTEDYEAWLFKNYFVRLRPYEADPSIQPCVAPEMAVERARSYPSGHATMGYAMGIVLANLMPGRAPAIMSRARLYAENRLVCGVHYRSDIIAGQVLGSLTAVQLMQNPEFQQMMQASKEELNEAGLLR